MRVLLNDLATFSPALKQCSGDEVASVLSNLGFEVESLRDGVFDLSITPNRGDAMSALGIARDLAAFYGAPVPTAGDDAAYRALAVADTVRVTISAKAQVPQYHGIIVEGVTIQPSTGWLRDAVTALGWRPINNLVDLTNVLMDRFGQPLHAMDLDALATNTLTIRASREGEIVTTLDGVVRRLPPGALVMDDGEQLVDLVGIMGGQASEIRSTTRRVLVHAAAIGRAPIRATTHATGLRTPAAIRYERGVDSTLGPVVLARIAELIEHDPQGMRILGRVTAARPVRPAPAIQLAPKKVNGLLGFTVTSARQRGILGRLGCAVTGTATRLFVKPPSWRFDLAIWQDLAEEIGRLEGLDERLPATPLPPWRGTVSRSLIEQAELVKDRLVDLGFAEVLTYSFTSKALLDAFEFEPGGELANPLNPTLKYLRPSLLPNLAHAVAANAAFDPLLLFEIGHVFHGEIEEVKLGLVLAGQTSPTNAWLKRIADALAVDPATFGALAAVLELSPEQRDQLKIRKRRVTLVECGLTSLLDQALLTRDLALPAAPHRFRPLSRFPVVSRDVAIVLDQAVDPTVVDRFIRSATPLIEDVELFDEFSSPQLGQGRKSLAFHIWYADPTRTLTESEVNERHESLVAALERTFDATRR